MIGTRRSGTLAAVAAAVVLLCGAPGTALAVGLPSRDTWLADVAAVSDEAKTYLEGRLPSASMAAIVLDIDDTSLESTYSPGVTCPAVAAVLEVARLAKSRGAAVFFVSNRREPMRMPTTYNLRMVGYPVDGLLLRPNLDDQPVERLKAQARSSIEAAGYTIVANIGNHATDLAGGHAERVFKLPDYDGVLQ
jgi:predicted secreted acid phosphatase